MPRSAIHSATVFTVVMIAVLPAFLDPGLRSCDGNGTPRCEQGGRPGSDVLRRRPVVAVLPADLAVGLGVLLELLRLGVEVQRLADPQRDVGQVADARRQVARLDVGVESLLVAANAIDEIR